MAKIVVIINHWYKFEFFFVLKYVEMCNPSVLPLNVVGCHALPW